MHQELYAEVSQAKLFAGVSMDAIERLLEWCTVIEEQPGKVLIASGVVNETVYVLLSGRLDVHLASLDHPCYVSLNAGDCVGEMSIIEGRETSAFVVVGAASRLLKIPKDILWSLISSSHAVACNMLFLLSGRLRHDNEAIKDSIRLRAEFEKMAFVDGLTGLHNRRWLDQAFGRQVDRSLRDQKPLTVLMVDIDHFKRYNDSYGHLVGDKAIRCVAQALNDNLRPGDLLARFGGEEFSLMLVGATQEQGLTVAERLRSAVAATVIPDEPDVPKVTVSLGCTQLVAGDTLEKMLQRADVALYRAKSAGRDCVRHE
ncbi:hypothetical protein BH11PSE11_BH11PSE11_26030 [soil metagenome]